MPRKKDYPRHIDASHYKQKKSLKGPNGPHEVMADRVLFARVLFSTVRRLMGGTSENDKVGASWGGMVKGTNSS